jgi:hypothetical protein
MTHFGLQTCEFWLGRSTRHHACYAAIARPEDERISAAPSVSTGRLDGSHVEAMWRFILGQARRLERGREVAERQTVKRVARRQNISRGILFSWRKDYCETLGWAAPTSTPMGLYTCRDRSTRTNFSAFARGLRCPARTCPSNVSHGSRCALTVHVA